MIVLVWDGQRLFMQMYLLIKREIIFNVVCMLLNDGKNFAVSRWGTDYRPDHCHWHT